MSNAFGLRGSSIPVYQDVPDNANNQALKKTKREDVQCKAPANKRAALCSITNSTRIQPSRAAKQGTTDLKENEPTRQGKSMFGSTASSQGFSIFIDGSTESSTETALSLQPTVHTAATMAQRGPRLLPGLTSLRQPLSNISDTIVIADSPFSQDSPMLLDTTIETQQQDLDTVMEERANIILSVPEYADDIYSYLREAELRNRARVGYMRKQPDITSSMRSILGDWLVEVSEEYKLHRETLCLSINYIDRFLSQMSVLRGKLQLVGTAAMFLAAKYEEIYPPEVGEFVYITDDTYTKKQVLRMEHLILKVLSFDIAVPTSNCFCEKYLRDGGVEETAAALAMFLIELSLIDVEPFIKYLPSVTAAAAICLANFTLGHEVWSSRLTESTGYEIRDFEECLRDLHVAFVRAPTHPQQAVIEKYKQAK
ncbi:hypothetical protein NP493_675g01027 [Ridgeia piscesae]|uniref:Cyclin A n=1 Tax=Ridgeia piscesae TaxID=27915 RepID=A0AAD9NPU0_RIDPI|nr:hypothetical protein NP493_675g01027 [Ridgeia piscesae]